MKHGKFIRNGIFAVALTTLAAGTAYAWPGGGGFDGHGPQHASCRHHGGGMHRFMAGLNLTDKQRDEIFKIRYEQKPVVREKMKALFEIRRSLRDATLADHYDAKHVKTLADKQAKLNAELIVMRSDTMHRIYSVLNPAQKKQLEEIRKQRAERFAERHSGKPGMPGIGGPGGGPGGYMNQ
ncbi:MAG: Spy/CpxP family protein refolding chaperone [Gammaproteobacteria bacterium]